MAEALELRFEWMCWVRVWEMAERRASFSGLGGIGGAGMNCVEALVGRGVSNGEVRRSAGAGGGGGGGGWSLG